MFPPYDIIRNKVLLRTDPRKQGRSLPVGGTVPQCRMLHPLFAMVVLLLLSGPAASVESIDPKALDVVTSEELQVLQARIAARTVSVFRHRTRNGTIVYPGGQVFHGQGWRLSHGEVLTASALVEGWSESAEDVLKVTIGDVTYSATVQRMDIRRGLAVIAVPVPSSPRFLTERWVAPKDSDLWGGRPLFAVGSGKYAQRYAVLGPAEGAFRYYLLAEGTLPIGAPLTDAKGRLLTLVGVKHFQRPQLMHLLPAHGMRWVTEVSEGIP
jgi:hypothetical protein